MTAEADVPYTARVKTIGSRARGLVRSSDGLLDVRLATPGTARIGTNPEQLLAAGWSACFASSIELAARRRRLALVIQPKVEAEVALQLADDGYFLSVRLNVGLDGLDRRIAKALVDEAHRICPFSKATLGNIDVAVRVT